MVLVVCLGGLTFEGILGLHLGLEVGFDVWVFDCGVFAWCFGVVRLLCVWNYDFAF